MFEPTPGTANEDFLYPVEDGLEGSLSDEELGEFVREGAQTLRIRGQAVAVNADSEIYAARGIELKESPRICVFELLRALLPEHRGELLATEAELRQRVPLDLPRILCLDEWNHPDLCAGDRPGTTQSFCMLADVLATGDVSRYKPMGASNTHWSNWPDGGSL